MPISKVAGIQVTCDTCHDQSWEDYGKGYPPVFASMHEAKVALTLAGWVLIRRVHDGGWIIICPACDAPATCKQRGHHLWHDLPGFAGSACEHCGAVSSESQKVTARVTIEEREATLAADHATADNRLDIREDVGITELVDLLIAGSPIPEGTWPETMDGSCDEEDVILAEIERRTWVRDSEPDPEGGSADE